MGDEGSWSWTPVIRHKRYLRILNFEVLAVRDIKLQSGLSKNM